MLECEINLALGELSTCKIWHGSPVWFLDGNPVVAYSKQKKGIKLLFWSGESFEDNRLIGGSGKFKDAGIFFNSTSEVNITDLQRWLKQCQSIQWDYKNIVKRKGELKRLK